MKIDKAVRTAVTAATGHSSFPGFTIKPGVPTVVGYTRADVTPKITQLQGGTPGSVIVRPGANEGPHEVWATMHEPTLCELAYADGSVYYVFVVPDADAHEAEYTTTRAAISNLQNRWIIMQKTGLNAQAVAQLWRWLGRSHQSGIPSAVKMEAALAVCQLALAVMVRHGREGFTEAVDALVAQVTVGNTAAPSRDYPDILANRPSRYVTTIVMGLKELL